MVGVQSKRIEKKRFKAAERRRQYLLTRLLGILVSAMLAVADCGGADMGKSVLATGPLRLSVSNPRYFTDGSQKVIYLTGSHTWANLQDMGIVDPPAKFDFTAFVKLMETHDHNFMRMWVSEQARWVPWTTDDVYVEPLPYVREGPDLALDGKPKFNLEKFNQKYFDRLRTRVIEAGEHGIYVSIMLFQGWSIEKKGRIGNPWPGHPFNKSNNINGIDGDLNGDNEGIELYTRSDDPRIVAALTRQEAYIKKVIDTVNELDNVLYEIANEAHSRSIPWQYHMINMIKLYESTKPKQHPVGMTSIGFGGPYDDTGDLFASPADWISPSTNRDDYKSNPPAADGSKVIIIDTDHIWGRGGDYVWVWKSFLKGLNPIFMDPWEPLPGSTNRMNDPAIPAWGPARKAMGDTLRYARTINLVAMVPRSDLCSSTFCLANPGIEYLVYLPFGSHWLERFMRFSPSHRLRKWITSLELVSCTVTVDLGQASRVWTVKWFNPRAGENTPGDPTTGSGLQSFTAPFRGDAVLYLVAQ